MTGLARAVPVGLGMLHDQAPRVDGFRDAVLSGLGLSQKAIPSKFLYDAEGSRLFERICELEEYYPTRTELAILHDHAGSIADALPEGLVIIEPGSGSSRKIRALLAALDRPRAYVPVDICREHLIRSARVLAEALPHIRIMPVCADFMSDVRMPDLPAGPRLAFFPGSTIGNLERAEALAFLARLARQVGPEGFLLIGVDLKKDVEVLHRAYNDSAGITAAFNLNLLARVNRELGGTFDLDAFAHRAPYVARFGRIEMHLVSQRDQTVRVAEKAFAFRSGETIHTENSHKYTLAEFRDLAGRTGFVSLAAWTDPRNLFSVQLFRVA